MNSKKRKKYLLPAAVLLIGFLCVVSYFIFCPVRTLGEVLERKGINYLSDNYDQKEYYSTHLFPYPLPGLQKDVLESRDKSPIDFEFEFAAGNETQTFCKLLSSLKIRKKIGEYHKHRNEDSYEYWIHFYWQESLRIILCKQELCFAFNPEKRYGSSKFNAYYVINCPENEQIFDHLLLLLEKEVNSPCENM